MRARVYHCAHGLSITRSVRTRCARSVELAQAFVIAIAEKISQQQTQAQAVQPIAIAFQRDVTPPEMADSHVVRRIEPVLLAAPIKIGGFEVDAECLLLPELRN